MYAATSSTQDSIPLQHSCLQARCLQSSLTVFKDMSVLIKIGFEAQAATDFHTLHVQTIHSWDLLAFESMRRISSKNAAALLLYSCGCCSAFACGEVLDKWGKARHLWDRLSGCQWPFQTEDMRIIHRILDDFGAPICRPRQTHLFLELASCPPTAGRLVLMPGCRCGDVVGAF